jgi:hypothetical protein
LPSSYIPKIKIGKILNRYALHTNFMSKIFTNLLSPNLGKD